MKFSIHLSTTSLMVIMAMVLGILMITDINAHRHSGAAAMTAGVASADKVVTKEFVLVDDNGATRARIGMNDAGSPCMQLFDRQGQQRAQLRLNGDDVPSLRLYDDSGTLRSALSFNLQTHDPALVLFDTNGVGEAIQKGGTIQDGSTQGYGVNTIFYPSPTGDSYLPGGGLLFRNGYRDEDAINGFNGKWSNDDRIRSFYWAGPDSHGTLYVPDGDVHLQRSQGITIFSH